MAPPKQMVLKETVVKKKETKATRCESACRNWIDNWTNGTAFTRFDIALLKLSRSVHFRDNILPICLPPHGKDYEGALGVVAGWGKTDTSFGKFSNSCFSSNQGPRQIAMDHKTENIVSLYYQTIFWRLLKDPKGFPKPLWRWSLLMSPSITINHSHRHSSFPA